MQELKLQNCGTVLAGMLLNVDPFAHIEVRTTGGRKLRKLFITSFVHRGLLCGIILLALCFSPDEQVVKE
jgi:hypothetical protein